MRQPSPLVRLARCQSGTTAVEFAMVLPLLVFVMGAICETGVFILYQTNLQFAADAAARQIRVNNVGPADAAASLPQMDVNAFKDLICQHLVVADCINKIHVDVRRVTPPVNQRSTFAELQKVVPPPVSVGPDSETYAPGAPLETGSLIVTYDWEFTFPGMAEIFGNLADNDNARRLFGISIYRNEP